MKDEAAGRDRRKRTYLGAPVGELPVTSLLLPCSPALGASGAVAPGQVQPQQGSNGRKQARVLKPTPRGRLPPAFAAIYSRQCTAFNLHPSGFCPRWPRSTIAIGPLGVLFFYRFFREFFQAL